ncbi:MAG: hypothetical protein Q9213_004349 [Squamulea squamosa]
MYPQCPDGFLPVSSLSSHINKEVDLMGVVTDFLPATKSKGSDWTCKFRLADTTTYDDGVKVQYFKPMETELPQVRGNGDVVILHKLKIKPWSGMTVGLSSRNTLWTVFPSSSIPEKLPTGRTNLKCIKEKRASAPTEEQMRYAIELCNSRDRTNESISPTSINPLSTNQTQTSVGTPSSSTVPSSSVGRRDKFALVKDVQIDTFYDLVGQVVKIYPSNGIVELYITDYTSNTLLFNYPWGHDDDEDSTLPKWKGPLGKHTLTVSLFSPHSYYAQNNIEVDQFVFLRNTRIKYSKDGKLEGSLHTDRNYPDRVDVTIVNDKNDDRVKNLLRRKLQYEKQWSKHKDAYISLHEGQKRKQEEEPKLSKNQVRKRRKQQREEEARNKKQQLTPFNDEDDKENDDPYRVRIAPKVKADHYQQNTQSTPATSPPPKEPAKRSATLNKNIRASNLDIPTRSLASILSHETFTTSEGISFLLPFRNIRSRAAVRVVDFYPRDVADFAVRKRQESEYDVLSDYEGDSESSEDDDRPKLPPDTDEEEDAKNDLSTQSDTDSNDEERSKWEWRFILILEDASAPQNPKEANERMTLYVGGADAEFLLKLDPCNLRRKPLRLAALEEKLFILWGDLAERMNAANEGDNGDGGKGVRSIPFVCCIKEYGVRSLRKRRRGTGDSDDGNKSNDGGVSGAVKQEENWGWERRYRMFGTTIL